MDVMTDPESVTMHVSDPPKNKRSLPPPGKASCLPSMWLICMDRHNSQRHWLVLDVLQGTSCSFLLYELCIGTCVDPLESIVSALWWCRAAALGVESAREIFLCSVASPGQAEASRGVMPLLCARTPHAKLRPQRHRQHAYQTSTFSSSQIRFCHHKSTAPHQPTHLLSHRLQRL